MAEVMQVMAFDCDLNHAVETQPLPNVLVKGDKDAHEVRITVMRGDTPVSIEGATVIGTGIMGMNVAVATGKAAGNVASFVLNEGFYAQHGEITLLLTVMLDGVETTVFRGVGNVLPSGSGKTVIDPGDVLGWGELQNAAKEATKAATNANAAAGEAIAAATNANDKANAAETATASVNAAKDKAETAAVNANREAAAAKTATQNADSAASKAILAAGDAEEQAAAANKATTAATQAAQSAQGVVQGAGAAIGELHDVVDDVQHKLDTGAFVGAQGEKGERGEQGIQGVPGKDGAPGIPGKDGAPGKDAPQIDDSTMTAANPWSSLHTVDMLCPPIDAAGNRVVCYPVAGYPLGVKASWAPTQEGAGEPSPENIRLIQGRDSVTIGRAGRNLLNPALNAYNTYKPYGLTITYIGDNLVRIKGTYNGTSDSSFVIIDTTQKWLSGKELKITGFTEEGTEQRYRLYGLRTEDETVIAMAAQFDAGNVIDMTVAIVVSQDTPSAYIPYTGQTTALTLPSTIYGGEVDAVTGQGAATWKCVTLNGGESWNTWGVNANNAAVTGFFTGDVSDYDVKNAKVICSHLTNTATDPWGGRESGVKLSNVGEYRYLMYSVPTALLADTSDNAAAIASLKSYFAAQQAAGTPVTISYKLATPIPFTATGGAPLPALAGTNTVLTDADSVQVTGRADIAHALAALAGRSAETVEALELLLSGDTGVQLHET